jgi:FMN reductase
MSLLAVNGSPSTTSKTRAVAEAAVQLAGGRVLDVSSLDADALLLRGSHPGVGDALAALAAADRIVLCTPVYRATYSGLLKVLLDLLPPEGLAGAGVVLAATAGSPAHFLALDTGLRPVVASVGGWCVPTVVYATGSDFDGDGRPSPEVVATLASALDEAGRVATRPA